MGLIGCVSQNQARNSLYLFQEILADNKDYDLDTQADPITMIESIVDFLQIHNLSDLIKFNDENDEEIVDLYSQTLNTNETVSPAQKFIKSLADIFYQTYISACKNLEETGELAKVSLTAIIKLYVRGILYSHTYVSKTRT